jgi:hypothetical protein
LQRVDNQRGGFRQRQMRMLTGAVQKSAPRIGCQ